MRDKKPSGSKKSLKHKHTDQIKIKKAPAKSSPHQNAPGPSVPFNHEPEDFLAIDTFCADIHLDEILLNDWEIVHEHLDLTVPVWLSAKEALEGCERSISFVKQIHEEEGKLPVRQKVEMLVQIPCKSDARTRIRIAGEGEIRGGKIGDLIVIINIKT